MTIGVKDLLASERGAWCLGVVFAATVLVLVGKLSGEAWIDFIKYTTVLIVGSKTVTTAVETVALKKPQIPRAEVVRENPNS